MVEVSYESSRLLAFSNCSFFSSSSRGIVGFVGGLIVTMGCKMVFESANERDSGQNFHDVLRLEREDYTILIEQTTMDFNMSRVTYNIHNIG